MARGVPPVALRAGLDLIRDQLRDYPTATAILDAGLPASPSPAINRSRGHAAADYVARMIS